MRNGKDDHGKGAGVIGGSGGVGQQYHPAGKKRNKNSCIGL
jgi:hypothetical protein